jgi:NarL family two-component system response regulator LiaR
MDKIKIIVADDHPLMREALVKHLREQADFEIMDISMPKVNGIDATRQIKTKCPDIAILVLTVHNDYERILGILDAGASGYLTKAAIGEEIVQAVRGVYQGETILSTPVSQELIKYAVRTTTKPLPVISTEKLNVRELEILKLAAKGMGNKSIAQNLNLSIPTVKTYIADIFSKLHATSRTEAVVTALRIGLINLQNIE